LFYKESFSQQIAFPGAEGFGKFAKGGRGGVVYHVTNLNDSGEGSLRYGVEELKGPRIIVFDVSGTIYLKKRIKVNKPFITIAGQTAPGDGITLTNEAFYIDTGHVIVRYIRVRLGDQSGGDDDAISITEGKNIILDHITASWSVDETLSCQSADVDSLTVQWSMITESLRYSHHAKGSHGYGGIIGCLKQTFHHNLYAHHSSRSPKVSGRRHCEVDFRNNVIYNWGYNNCYDGTSSYLNWANNYYKSGPATDYDKRKRIFELSDEDIEDGSSNSPEDSQLYETSLYAEGNIVDGFPEVTNDNWAGGIDFKDGAVESRNRVDIPFEFPLIEEQTAEEAYPLVLASAGASSSRDPLDSRIVNEAMTGSSAYGNFGIIDSQDDVGGCPELYSIQAPLDTDKDGMPDYWEEQFGLDIDNSADNNFDLDSDKYLNIEEYLNNTTPTGTDLPVVYTGSLNSRAIETDGVAGTFTIYRTDYSDDSLVVTYSVSGTASNGIDYETLTGKAVIEPGQMSTEVIINPLNDQKSEETELVVLTLQKSNSDYYLGCPVASLVAIQDNEMTAIVENSNNIPSGYALNQNYPNPFNPETKITFNLSQSGYTRLSVFNLIGQEVDVLVSRNMVSGSYSLSFDAVDLPSGIYYYRIQSGDFIAVKKMMLIK